MARGTILREWKCDVCGRVVRDDLGGAGDTPLPPAGALDSWKLPDKWRRILIEESNGTTRDVTTTIGVDSCEKCFETGASCRLGKLDETAKTVSGFYEPRAEPKGAKE